MATLDVSEALDCAEFQDSFQIISRTFSINNSGENVLVESAPTTVSGIIQAASSREIQLLPEAFRSTNAIRVYYKGTLSVDDQGEYSDCVIWKGFKWRVKMVDDWSNWGDGYVKAIAVYEEANFG